MSYTDYVSNYNSFCRICLTKSSKMSSIENKYNNSSKDSPTIIEVLENILGEKVNCDSSYPRNVCYTCINSMKCSVNIKDVFQRSQSIFKKYISLKSLAVETIEVAEQLDNVTNKQSEIMRRARIQGRQTWPRCQYCYQRFKTKDLVQEHVTQCEKIIRVKCDYCDKIMVTRENLRSHLRLKHCKEIGMEPLKLKCDQCDEVFNSTNSLSYHKTTRHYSKGEMFPCKLCTKSFMLRNSLRLHMQSHNKDEKQVVCPICGKSFHYSGGLFYHMKIHKNERKYSCTICNHNFLNISALKKHNSTHTKERPYVCAYCSKSFSSKCDVLIHEKRHTGDKSHPCKYCDKKFITLWTSKLHMSSHPGTYQCEKCFKGFLNEDVLKLHYHFKHNSEVQEISDDEIID